jgi:hypothetical protein
MGGSAGQNGAAVLAAVGGGAGRQARFGDDEPGNGRELRTRLSQLRPMSQLGETRLEGALKPSGRW